MLFSALAVAAAAIVGLSASANTGSLPGLAALRICDAGPLPQPAGRYRYVILRSSEYGQIGAIKRASPQTRVLVYKDVASTRDDAGESYLPTGVSYAYANRYHPEWFLLDRRGRRVNWADWPDFWQMDVGSRSYQRTWARNVERDVDRHGWDGAFLDGISRTMQYPWYLNGRILAKYPGPNDYARATTRFLRQVGPLLAHHGLVVGNINDAGIPLWNRWLRYLSGVSREWWTKADPDPGAGAITGAQWRSQMRLLSTAAARKKIFVAITYGRADDLPAMDYARASFLLFARGSKAALSYAPFCGTEPASDRWKADLGAPLAAARRIEGVWRRDYTDGVAVVNPSRSATIPLALGEPFVKPSGKVVRLVVLPPHTAQLLRRP